MLFGKDKKEGPEFNFNEFLFNLNQKSRLPISQSINFSEEALKKAAIRKVLNDRSSRCSYTTLGLLNITPKGHLIDTKA